MSQIDNRRRGTSHTNSSRDRQRGGTAGRNSRNSGGNRSGKSSRNAGGGRGNSRSTYRARGGSLRGPRRKRRPRFGVTGILTGIIVAAVAVICIVAVFKLMGGRAAKAESDQMTGPAGIQLHKEVSVDGVAITGMSRAEAKKAILDKYPWGLKISYNDDTYDVANLLEPRVDALLEEIYAGTPKESYTLDISGMEAGVQAEVKKAAAKWNVSARNGSISGFDKASGQFIYSGEQSGFQIDETQLAGDIQARLNSRDFSATVKATGHPVGPEITEEQAKKMYQVIGTYTTTTTSNKDRNKNIELSSEALNGLILQPGEEFSFNKATGERSREKGYRPAGAYVNGELVEEPGGGVCQLSSTLYNAVVFSGLTTTERHAHSYEPSYVTPGEDATVSFGGPDMKFVNNSSSAIAIRTSFADRKLKISIVGIPILEKGVVISMDSKKTAELDAPAPVYVEDQTLQPGVEKVVKQETKGSRWVTNLVTKKDGAEVSNEFLHNSTYRGKPATISRNTSGVVIPAATEAPKESEGTSEKPSAAVPSVPETQGQTQAPDPNQQHQTKPQGPGGQMTPDENQTLQQGDPGQNGSVNPDSGKSGAVLSPVGNSGNAKNAGNTGNPGNGDAVPVIPAGP